MSTPFILSCVITGWNCQRYARQCLKSLFSQNYPHWRAVVVDDASTDATVARIREHGSDSRLTVIELLANLGAAHARHMAFEHLLRDRVENDIAVLLDLDDYLAHPSVFDRVIREYQAGAHLTTGSWRFHEKIEPWQQKPYPAEVQSKRAYRSLEFRCTHLRTFQMTYASQVPARLLKDASGAWLRRYTDVALLLPILESIPVGTLSHIEDTLYVYRGFRQDAARFRYRNCRDLLESIYNQVGNNTPSQY